MQRKTAAQRVERQVDVFQGLAMRQYARLFRIEHDAVVEQVQLIQAVHLRDRRRHPAQAIATELEDA